MTGLFWLFIGFVGMEVASIFIHQFLFHGPLWFIHKTHHRPNSGFFELNDLFSLIFGGCSVYLIVTGASEMNASFFVGLGIALYGWLYFILHDIAVHRRIKNKIFFKNKYLNWVQRAHWEHHKTQERDGSVSFGLFWIPLHLWKKFKVEKR
ncbi:MAG: sterol desaturase family protein [Bacteroidia bacterium]